VLILSYGIPKSGSTLAYELIRGILEASGHEQETFINDRKPIEDLKPHIARNFVWDIDRDKIQGMLSVVEDRFIAVKTHSKLPVELLPWIDTLQSQKKIQVIASYRDPRDICLSLMDAGDRAQQKGKKGFSRTRGLDSAASHIQRRIQHFRVWGAAQGTLRLDYDEVAFEPDKAIDKIEDRLGVKCDREQAMKYAFEDARTQKNKAKRHRYIDEFDESQKAELYELFRDFIENVCERNNDAWFGEIRERLVETPTA